MSSSNWRDGEIRELLTIMGEKVMQSHLTKRLKDGVWKNMVSNIKNMLVFLHLQIVAYTEMSSTHSCM